MTSFHEAIKDILNEVEKFLVETIKKEKLSKASTDQKQTLLDKITKLRDDYPALSKPEKDESKAKQDLDKGYSDESSRTGGSSAADEFEDQYSDSNIPAIPATELKDTLIDGYLEKKQKKGTLFGAPKLQKRWCVIKGSAFYYYESPKEKKQHGSFYLNGYGFELAPDVLDKRDAAKKELSFQIVSPGKRTYQFVALSKDDLEKWKLAIQKAASLEEQEGEGEVYEPIEDNPEDTPEDLIQEDIYEPCGGEEEPGEMYDDTLTPSGTTEEGLEQDEVYDDCGNTAAPEPPPMSSSRSLPPTPTAKNAPGRRMPPPPPPPMGEEPSTPPVPPPIPPGRNVPHIPLPEIPTTPKEEKKPFIHPDQDYENKYYGKYDCTADEEHELAFKKGDLILVISKHFDAKDWWVGKLHNKYGLVPKHYLTPAFEMKTQA